MRLLSKKSLSRLGLAALALLCKPAWADVGDFDGDRRMDVAWYEL
jgi:hypothetical protein